MSRCVVLVTIAALSGCSLGMKRVEPDYDPRTIPRCETKGETPVGDALVAVLAIGGAAAIAIAAPATDNEGVSKWVWVAGLGIVGGIEILVAKAGFGWHRECEKVKRDWDQMQIEQDTLVRQEAAKKRLEEIKAREPTPAPVAGSQPRGFFCSNSPSNVAAGFCAREKAECARTREAALVGVVDLAECTITERAFCFGDRCAPSADACSATRARVIGPDGSADECEERE